MGRSPEKGCLYSRAELAHLDSLYLTFFPWTSLDGSGKAWLPPAIGPLGQDKPAFQIRAWSELDGELGMWRPNLFRGLFGGNSRAIEITKRVGRSAQPE
jgi:hypothetical protein